MDSQSIFKVDIGLPRTWRISAILQIRFMVGSHLIFVDVDAQARLIDSPPTRARGDGDFFAQHVSLHELRGLLIAVGDVGKR